MALYHRATIVPSKAEMVTQWVLAQPWAPPGGDQIEVIGSYRFDDPEGQVGMEAHLVTSDGIVLHVPMTYRDAPLDGADSSLMGQMEHSVLGTRWVYDGLGDPAFVAMLAAVSMTGQGEALGVVRLDDRWVIVPSNVRIHGGGWGLERVAVDGFEVAGDDGASVLLRNDHLELRVFHRPVAGPQPPTGLTASWAGTAESVVLTEVTERNR